jgi:hypothetical protein
MFSSPFLQYLHLKYHKVSPPLRKLSHGFQSSASLVLVQKEIFAKEARGAQRRERVQKILPG